MRPTLPLVKIVSQYINPGPSRGGLEVERWSDNRTDPASVGLNPALGIVYRSSSIGNSMSHIHMNARRRA